MNAAKSMSVRRAAGRCKLSSSNADGVYRRHRSVFRPVRGGLNDSGAADGAVALITSIGSCDNECMEGEVNSEATGDHCDR